MRRFARSFGMSLLAVLVIGVTVIIATGGVASQPAGQAQVAALAQTEDGAEGDDADEDDPAAGPALPIEQLLTRLSPSAEGESLPSAQRVVLSRDPFQPVVPEPADGDSNGDTDGDTNGDTDGDTNGDTDGDTNGDTDGDTNGDTDGDTNGDTNGDTDDDGEVCTGDEAETVCDGIVVTVDGFTDDGLAMVTIDGTSYDVGVGDEFATSFRVLAINQPCVTLLFGDEAFSICTGATVLK